MNILHLCPSNIATGGTEGIHHLVDELNKCGANAKILYVGDNLNNPQPKVYSEKYNCPYITQYPKDFKGVIIFPEIWGNMVIEEPYCQQITAILWQGIDVYDWHTKSQDRGKFLRNKSTIHITMSEYGMEHLRGLGLNPIKIPDCINDAYFQDFSQEYERVDKVLYNPTSVKMTRFQEIVMAKCTTELGIRFKPLENYSQEQLIDIFRHSKLYIDFGVFSGRERLPREAVMCGCCILTSNKGTAKAYLDNSILDKYKICDINTAIKMIQYCLHNYELCKPDFDEYRKLLKNDLTNYSDCVKSLYDRFSTTIF